MSFSAFEFPMCINIVPLDLSFRLAGTPSRIIAHYRITSDKRIKICTIHKSRSVCTYPPAQPRCIIPRPVVFQPTFFIPLHARISITLGGGFYGGVFSLVSSGAVGVVFFVGGE